MGTQLSNPRTAKGNPLRCPECGRYEHPGDTSCQREMAALTDTEGKKLFYRRVR